VPHLLSTSPEVWHTFLVSPITSLLQAPLVALIEQALLLLTFAGRQ
jgi:hypothetical protein